MMWCARCGRHAGDEPWRKWCRDCYAQIRREEDAAKENEIVMLRAELRGAKLQIQSLQMMLSTLRQSRNAPSSPLSKLTIRRMLMLCHPDRHGNSDMSRTVTQELVKMLESAT